MSKETRLARRAAILSKLSDSVDRIKRKDVRIMKATQLAAHVTYELNEDGDKVPVVPDVVDGHRLTNLDKRVAVDARNSKRDAPMYLELAAKRYDVEQKIQALRPSPSPLNATMVAFVMGNVESTARYPVIDVEAKDVTPSMPALPAPEPKGDPQP